MPEMPRELWKRIAVGYCEWTNGDWPDEDDLIEARAAAKHIAGYVSPEGSERPTHLCLDCGAVGYAGGYHDHGNGNAGDTASIESVLASLRAGGDARDDVERMRDTLYTAHAFIKSVTRWDGQEDDRDEALAEIDDALAGRL